MLFEEEEEQHDGVITISEIEAIDIIKILRESEGVIKRNAPEILTNYAMPITMALREDPPDIVRWPNREIPDKRNRALRKAFEEYKMLISSHTRAGNKRLQAHAHFSAGIVLDNIEEIEKAIHHYLECLEIMIELEDFKFQKVVYNALGVNYQLLGSEWFEKSAFCHSKHAELSGLEGKFLSAINLGLLYLTNSLMDKAEIALQTSLRFAVQMESAQAEAIAFCLQGLNYICLGDYIRSLVCMERYSQLSIKTDDVCGQARASLNIGHISYQTQCYDTSQTHYENAMQIANLYDDIQIENQAKISLGVLRKAQKKLQEETKSNFSKLAASEN